MDDNTLLLITLIGLMVTSGLLIVWYAIYHNRIEPRIRQRVSQRLGVNIVRRRHMNGYHWQVEESASCLMSIGVLLLNMLADVTVVFLPISLLYGAFVVIMLTLGRS